jgi:hypothetical protein
MATKKATTSRAALMREHYTENPTATVSEVAKKFKTTYSIAYMCKKEMEKRRKWQLLEMTSSNTPLPSITMVEPQPDPVNHPYHYKVGGIETIDFIEAKELNYNMGNAVKYISRADHKGNRLQDLEKAKWYIDRELAKT